MRTWPYVRLWGFLLVVFTAALAPFLVAVFLFGAPWWIAYFAIVPTQLGALWGRQFAQARRWMR